MTLSTVKHRKCFEKCFSVIVSLQWKSVGAVKIVFGYQSSKHFCLCSKHVRKQTGLEWNEDEK